MRYLTLAVSLVALAGCGPDDVVVPPIVTPNASALVGEWAQSGTVVGSSFVFTLTARDSTVSGTGHYTIEAGRSGTLTVLGTAGTARTSLDFAFDSGTEAHFEGPPAVDGVLDGAIRYGPVGSPTPLLAITLTRRN